FLHYSLFFLYHLILFFFNDPPTTEIYTLSLHDALPISAGISGAECAFNSRRDDSRGRISAADGLSAVVVALRQASTRQSVAGYRARVADVIATTDIQFR